MLLPERQLLASEYFLPVLLGWSKTASLKVKDVSEVIFKNVSYGLWLSELMVVE